MSTDAMAMSLNTCSLAFVAQISHGRGFGWGPKSPSDEEIPVFSNVSGPVLYTGENRAANAQAMLTRYGGADKESLSDSRSSR